MPRELLDSVSESDLDYLLSCATQRRAAALISSFVADLRDLAPEDYFGFQAELFQAIYEAEGEQAKAARNSKRARSGKSTPSCASPTWEIERILWQRIARQLRTVGDALAWRLFGYDRRIILALSQNDQSGTMRGKEGLGHELGAVVEYQRTGTFALLHGVTNCLRIADLTVFEPDMPKLQEIKATPGGSRHRAQIRRVQRAIGVINGGAPLGPNQDTELFVASQPIKTRMADLRRQLANMGSASARSVALGDQHVLTIFSASGDSHPPEQALEEAWRLKRRSFLRANLPESNHHLSGHSLELAGGSSAIAPATIFPLPPDQTAALTTGRLVFEATIGWDRLARAFERHGFEVDLPLHPWSGRLNPTEPVLTASARDRIVTINGSGIVQLLFELVDIDRYVAGIAEYAHAERSARLGSGVITFANERAVWR